MTSRGTAKDAKLVLDAQDIHVSDVQKIRGPQIRGQVLLHDFESDFRRIIVAVVNVIYRDDRALKGRKL
jgi:hypothetical protein